MTFRVDPKNLDINLITDVDQLTWVIDTLSAHFADVNQTFNSWFQFDKAP